MKLTVVTTTYNQEKYIGQAIEGMLMQKTNFPFKIVISNDCSTDKTDEIIKKFQKENPEKIEIIKNEKNLGAMQNFINTLTVIKDTEYVALCDGDDYWTDENKLQKQVDFLDNNKEFSLCFHKAKMIYEKGEKEEKIIPENIEEITTIEDLVEQNYIVANSVVYRWKFNNVDLKEIFPTDIVPGDYYIHLLHAQEGKIKMINEVMSVYRRHEEGMWWNDLAKEIFTIKYGRKILNFYNAAEKNIKLPEKAFYLQKKDVIYNMIVTYVKKEEPEKAFENMVSKADKKIYTECMKDIVNRNIWFQEYLVQREEEEKIRRNKEKENENELKYYKKEFEECLRKMEKYKAENESIKNSKWWKLREKIKGKKIGEKKNG